MASSKPEELVAKLYNEGMSDDEVKEQLADFGLSNREIHVLIKKAKKLRDEGGLEETSEIEELPMEEETEEKEEAEEGPYPEEEQVDEEEETPREKRERRRREREANKAEGGKGGGILGFLHKKPKEETESEVAPTRPAQGPVATTPPGGRDLKLMDTEESKKLEELDKMLGAGKGESEESPKAPATPSLSPRIELKETEESKQLDELDQMLEEEIPEVEAEEAKEESKAQEAKAPEKTPRTMESIFGAPTAGAEKPSGAAPAKPLAAPPPSAPVTPPISKPPEGEKKGGIGALFSKIFAKKKPAEKEEIPSWRQKIGGASKPESGPEEAKAKTPGEGPKEPAAPSKSMASIFGARSAKAEKPTEAKSGEEAGGANSEAERRASEVRRLGAIKAAISKPLSTGAPPTDLSAPFKAKGEKRPEPKEVDTEEARAEEKAKALEKEIEEMTMKAKMKVSGKPVEEPKKEAAPPKAMEAAKPKEGPKTLTPEEEEKLDAEVANRLTEGIGKLEADIGEIKQLLETLRELNIKLIEIMEKK